ncbi:DUF86 domain-containing protein [Microbacteriaceae bacterium VKM Ac-2854]|nr:DUF86 domain-containing protein [Microbacteriaceae bacterium VKM Ac-2854]
MDGEDAGAFGATRRDVSEERKIAQWPLTVRALAEAVTELEEIAAGGRRGFFADDAAGRMARRAAKSALIDLGNAAFFVPTPELIRFSYVPWANLRQTRDKLAHVYTGTDWTTIWRVIAELLPTDARRFLDEVAGEYGDEGEGGA